MALKKKNIYIATDVNQCIFGKKWSFDDVLPGQKIIIKPQKKTFRCTKSIARFAESLRCHNDYLLNNSELLETIEPKTAEGVKPKIICLLNRVDEDKFIAEYVKKMIEDHPTWNIGVLCTTRLLCDRIRISIENEGVHCDYYRDQNYSSTKPGVKVSTIHSAKGLEFRAVFIPYFDTCAYDGKIDRIYSTKYNELKNRDTVYVAITRAMDNLVITYNEHNKHSIYLSEFDSDLYDFIDMSGLGVLSPKYISPKIIQNEEIKENKGLELEKKNPRKPVTFEYVEETLKKMGLKYERMEGNSLYVKGPLSETILKELEEKNIRLKENLALRIYTY